MGRLSTKIPQRYLVALGRVTVNFQLLEHHLAKVARAAISSNVDIGRIITSELRFQGLLDAVAGLYSHHVRDADRVRAMKRVLKRASDAEAERNRLLHSLWIGGSDARRRPYRVKVTVRRKRGLAFDAEYVPLSRLTRLSARLEEIAFDVIDIEVEILKRRRLP